MLREERQQEKAKTEVATAIDANMIAQYTKWEAKFEAPAAQVARSPAPSDHSIQSGKRGA